MFYLSFIFTSKSILNINKSIQCSYIYIFFISQDSLRSLYFFLDIYIKKKSIFDVVYSTNNLVGVFFGLVKNCSSIPWLFVNLMFKSWFRSSISFNFICIDFFYFNQFNLLENTAFFKCSSMLEQFVHVERVSLMDQPTALINYNFNDSFFIDSIWKYRLYDQLKFFIIKDNINLFQFFKSRFGIGSYISTMICRHIGIHLNYKYKYLNITFFYSEVRFFFLKHNNILDSRLAEYILSRHKRLLKIGNYRSVRLFSGYPSHGQRTRSNSKTAAKYPYTLKPHILKYET